MQVKNTICRNRLRGIEDAVEPLRGEHLPSASLEDVETLVRECLWLFDLLKEWGRDCWERAFSPSLEIDLQAVGDLYVLRLDETIRAVEWTRTLVTVMEDRGLRVEQSAELSSGLEGLRHWRADFQRRWPFADARQLEHSRRALVAGDRETAEEILRGLQGADPEAD